MVRKKVTIKRAPAGSTMSKKKKALLLVVSVFLFIAVTLSVVLPIALKKTNEDIPFKIPALNLPIEEKYALQKYSLDELDDTVTTIRADVMNVTQRNLPRAQTTLLSDNFSLVYNSLTKELTTDYENIISSSETIKTATISFSDYPSPSNSVDGAGYYTNGKVDGTNIDSATFYKYMLMTQGQHLAKEAQELSEKGELTQEWLKKHPAADSQYGEVLGTDNAVQKEITLDPIYRSLHATGLYLPAGELVTVKVEGLKTGEKISMVIGRQNSLAWRGSVGETGDAEFNTITGGIGNVTASSYDTYFTKADVLAANGKFESVTLQSQWGWQNNRMPWIIAEFTFDHNGEYKIGTAFGGIMHINMNNCYSSVKTTITGAVETPHYILGVTTPEYFDTYLRNAPGVVGVMDTENGQLIGPTGQMNTTSYMRQIKTEEVESLAMLWHSFFSVNESFTGGTYNRNNLVLFDQHVPAGAAVALGGYVYACPTGWFNGAMNYRGLLESGQWGILHEIGHNHGSAYGTIWGFNGDQEGEVRNNALTLLGYIMFCDVGTTVRMGGSAEHGAYANPYSTLTETLNQKGKYEDTNDCGYFQMLGMYANIMHSFGAEKYYELLYTYKENSSFASNKRADFAYRCSTVYGMNFIKYFNDFYSAKITDSMFTAEQLSYMNSLPNYEPISNFYAGGIDGVKTAGDYLVGYGDDLEFDLLNTTISSLDKNGKKGFEILSGASATYGKVKDLGDGKISYTFSTKYFGNTDEIKFKVKLDDGVIHEFTIYLRISYESASVTLYDGIGSKYINLTNDELWNKLEELMQTVTPTTSNSTVSGDPSFTSSEIQVRVVDFYWKATVSGEITLGVRGNGAFCIYFGSDFDNLTRIKTIQGNSAYGSSSKTVKVTVEAGKYYAIRFMITNNFRLNDGCGAIIGLSYDGKTFKDFSDFYNPNYPLGSYHKDYNPKKINLEKYVFEPQYIVSKKDGIKVATTSTDKGIWQVLKAPGAELLGGSRYETIERVELEKDEEGNPTGNTTTYTIEVDKWSYLIDGDTGTYLHTVYGTGKPQDYVSDTNPFEFVIDTGREQSFNYFTITTRNGGSLSVSKITKYELQISSSGKDSEWKTISLGDKLEYTNNVATLKFESVTGRYLKLIVKGSTGNRGQFVVISEIDAGIDSRIQRLVPATSSLLFATKRWTNSSEISTLPNGYMVAEKKNQKMVVRFNGEDLALYAAVGEDFGIADIKLDGKYYTTIDFSSSVAETRKLMLNIENLEDETHTLEIITKSSGRVMIYMLGIDYTSEIINAPNIYKERALTISLVVFLLLFVAVFVFVMCLLFIPKFRKLMGNNRCIAALDRYLEKQKVKRQEKRKLKKDKKETAKKQDSSKNTKVKNSPSKQKETKPQQQAKKQPESKVAPATKTTKAIEKKQEVKKNSSKTSAVAKSTKTASPTNTSSKSKQTSAALKAKESKQKKPAEAKKPAATSKAQPKKTATPAAKNAKK